MDHPQRAVLVEADMGATAAPATTVRVSTKKEMAAGFMVGERGGGRLRGIVGPIARAGGNVEGVPDIDSPGLSLET